MSEQTEDEKEFGADRWVYCKQHLRPHVTGWCTVSNKDKIALNAKTRDEAYAEARIRGLKIYDDEMKS